MLTGLANRFLLELTLKNGAQQVLYKSSASGDILDVVILKAISKVKMKKAHQRPSFASLIPNKGVPRQANEEAREGPAWDFTGMGGEASCQ